MNQRHVLIIGGGLAGLSAGCHALRNGYRVTVVEHNLALGGVCTAWRRGKYVVDGCIHWLTCGPFQRLYEELDILPRVGLRTIDSWVTYRDVREGFEVEVTRDLDALVANLSKISDRDTSELSRLRRAATDIVQLEPRLDEAYGVNVFERLTTARDLLHTAGSLVHFRKPVGEWAREHIHSPRLRAMLTRLVPESAPALFLAMILGYLESGYLARPVGGTAAFRDALIANFRRLGGEARLHATVDEVTVRGDRATGVRLADGELIPADVVISTSSAPETVLRLLGGRYDAQTTHDRMARWKTFDPIVLASFGVTLPYREAPGLLVVDGLTPFAVGGKINDSLYARVCNDEPSVAPPGHTVVQAMIPTKYEWWATRGDGYNDAKQDTADTIQAQLDAFLPGLRGAVAMVDVATPLSYWQAARSWRGAYEGWMPNSESFLRRTSKKLAGLSGFYMAGQWVEPGGGVPLAIMSGRQVVELLCADNHQPFAATGFP